MPVWEAFVDSLGIFLVLIAAAFAFLFIRRRLLSRGGGTFECSVRFSPPSKPSPVASARGWTLGLGRYAGDRLQWFRVFSFRPRPQHIFERNIRVITRRRPEGAEAFALYSGHHVVEVALGSGSRVELAMSEAALTGFLAWTEAAPPGDESRLGRRR
jgi:hypothetical protein